MLNLQTKIDKINTILTYLTGNFIPLKEIDKDVAVLFKVCPKDDIIVREESNYEWLKGNSTVIIKLASNVGSDATGEVYPGKMVACFIPEPYTTSVDAVIELFQNIYPDVCWTIVYNDGAFIVTIHEVDNGSFENWYFTDKSLPYAILYVLLRLTLHFVTKELEATND